MTRPGFEPTTYRSRGAAVDVMVVNENKWKEVRMNKNTFAKEKVVS